MSPARSAATPARKARPDKTPPPRPRRVASRRPIARVRWERVGRIGLLLVLAVVGGLYVQHALELISTHAQAQRQLAIVRTLVRSNAALIKERNALNNPATIQRDARALGMVRVGERPYVVTGRRSP